MSGITVTEHRRKMAKERKGTNEHTHLESKADTEHRNDTLHTHHDGAVTKNTAIQGRRTITYGRHTATSARRYTSCVG